MRKLLAVLLFLALGASTAHAGPGGCTNAPSLFPFADEAIAISSTALPLTASTYAPAGLVPADMAVCTVETDSVRYRLNGLNPTAAVGQLLYVTATAPQSITICGTASIRRFRVIRVTTDAAMTCTYYRIGDS